MQFTKLRLQGFKSFVDPTELVIHEGLTGVVGPNGCGKSNLLEALRWVMGENRARAMRGDGMEDVIFAGTSGRPARGRASVDLLIDNTDRRAPAAFNTQDTIEVSRQIARDLGSQYTLNGKTVRARDVQMLFADASTGAHSPALVRQGQISELINAKPKARRRILEEAAGISGLYQRRHEAELKLNAAEANLGRVDDVLEGLETQLRNLERQAAQARRYRDIAAQLRTAEAALLLSRWHDAEKARLAAEAELGASLRQLAAADAAVLAAERAREEAVTALPPLREEETVAAAVLQRLTIEQAQLAERKTRAEEEIVALQTSMGQLSGDLDRERALGTDAAESLARLAREAEELHADAVGHDAAQTQATDAAREAAAALAREEECLDRLSEDAARLTARAQAAERRVAETRTAETRSAAELARAETSLAALETTVAEAARRVEELREAELTARQQSEEAETALAGAEAALAAARTSESTARGEAAEADGALGAIAAEARGLERLLARADKDVRQMIDCVTAAAGYEAALGAALGEDLSLPPVDEAAETSGWRRLESAAEQPDFPAGAEPLGPHVSAPAELSRRLGQIAVVARADGAVLQSKLRTGQRLVSREGDLWRWDGMCLMAGDAPSSAALRLQQKNRLAELLEAETAARTARDVAKVAHAEAEASLRQASAAEQAARGARKQAEGAASTAARQLSRVEADLELGRGKLEDAARVLAACKESFANAETERAGAESTLAEIGDASAEKAAVETQRQMVAEARGTMLSARARVDEVERLGRRRAKRLAEIANEEEGWRARAQNAGSRLADLERRLADTTTAEAAARQEPIALAKRDEEIAAAVQAAETRRKAAADRLAEADAVLATAEATLRTAQNTATERREQRARLEATRDAAVMASAAAEERIREDLQTTAAALAERLSAEETPEPSAIETEVAKLRRQRDALGAVNLRAEEDARETETERETLAAEKAELEAAIAKLRAGIAELNREGRSRLLGAFDSVNEKFLKLFQHLFGGGEAKLVMVESDDPLDAGLEILCQPPGKKLASLSLLSGGEQTLTALSLIFAVFLSNPAPVCVLDEVDAPLDDANVGRFCDLLDEMCRLTETRFLIITHNAVTMSRMNRLFGVTMVERGVSQLVSVDLARAAALVDA